MFVYGSADHLETMGKFTGTFSFQRNQKHNVLIHVLKGNNGSFLSYNMAKALRIVNLHIYHVTSPHNKLFEKYPSLFKGIGQLKDVEVKLHIDDTVMPVAQQPWKIPFHVCQKVEAELHNLEKKGIIERVEGPTPWVSPLVITPKKHGGV